MFSIERIIFHYIFWMIKSQTLLSFKSMLLKQSFFKTASSVSKSDSKVSAKRMKELKILLMLSLIKSYKKQYIFRVNYNDLALSINTFTYEEYTFKCFESLQLQLEKLINKINKSEKENDEICTSKIDIKELGEGNYGYVKLGTREIKNRQYKSQMVSRYEHEVKEFQKLNLIIDNLEHSNIISKSIEYLNVLKDIMTNLRTIVYKYFKKLKEIDGQKTANIKLYCQNIFQSFRNIGRIINTMVDKDAKYQKYQKKFTRYQMTVTNRQDIIKHFQVLLYYFNSTLELKRLYEISSKLSGIAHHNPGQIDQLIKVIIKLRHMLGYLSKEIVNFNVSKREGLCGSLSDKDIWKSIYEKKFQSSSYKKRLRLE